VGLDIRLPLGLIFLIIGGIMAAYGLFTRGSSDLYAKSMDININLIWGSLMLVFGLAMFLAGRRRKWQDDPVTPRPWERDGAPPRH